MRYGEVYSYRNAKEAKKYLGKKGVFSFGLYLITEHPSDCIEGILHKVWRSAHTGLGIYAPPFEPTFCCRFHFFRPILEEEENRGNLGKFSPKRGNMRFGEIFNYGNAEKAKKFIGKKGIFSDYLLNIIEEPEGRRIGTLVDADDKNVFPFTRQDEDDKRVSFQFFRPVLEDDELMTNRQFAEWLAKGKGECTLEKSLRTYSHYDYSRTNEHGSVPDSILIRHWGDTEWVKPTKAIYEEDCE